MVPDPTPAPTTGPQTRRRRSPSPTNTAPPRSPRIRSGVGHVHHDIDILITLGIPLATSSPSAGRIHRVPGLLPAGGPGRRHAFNNYPEFNYEKDLEAQPDLILNGLGYEPEIPKKLNPIAPTYNYNGFDGADWRTQFKKTAEVLHRTEQYQAWMDKYQARVDEVKAKIKAAGIDPVVANIAYYDGKIGVDCYGIAVPGLRRPRAEDHPVGTRHDGKGTQLSLEQLDKLKGIDEVFTSVGVDENPSLLQSSDKLNASSVWKDLGFVKDDQITGFDMEMVYGSPSGQMALVDEVEKALLP